MKKSSKYVAPMTPMQKREWEKSVKQVDTRSNIEAKGKKPPESVIKPPKGKTMNPKAVRDYDEVITRKLNSDDRKR